MTLLKNLPKDLKIFFFLIAARNLLRGVPLESIRGNIKNMRTVENQKKFQNIHEKLTSKQIITADELEFLVEYERKRQWDKF
jgi:hypothetical protein